MRGANYTLSARTDDIAVKHDFAVPRDIMGGEAPSSGNSLRNFLSVECGTDSERMKRSGGITGLSGGRKDQNRDTNSIDYSCSPDDRDTRSSRSYTIFVYIWSSGGAIPRELHGLVIDI